MARSYIIEKEKRIEIKRQAANTGSLEFILPDNLDPSLFEIRFVAKTERGKVIFKKDPEDWLVDGQEITAPLSVEDTEGYQGTHKWELEIRNAFERISVGKGPFIIDEKLIS